jgi:FtsP/CotA-like multicopper oxidase with cupredoxin domain
MMVNGVLWPKMILKRGLHRLVVLNACNSRFLNIWFENDDEKIPFELIRVDGSYYNQPVRMKTLLTTPSSRF